MLEKEISSTRKNWNRFSPWFVELQFLLMFPDNVGVTLLRIKCGNKWSMVLEFKVKLTRLLFTNALNGSVRIETFIRRRYLQLLKECNPVITFRGLCDRSNLLKLVNPLKALYWICDILSLVRSSVIRLLKPLKLSFISSCMSILTRRNVRKDWRTVREPDGTSFRLQRSISNLWRLSLTAWNAEGVRCRTLISTSSSEFWNKT